MENSTKNTRYIWGGIIAILALVWVTIAILGQSLKETKSDTGEELADMEFRLDKEIAERRQNQTQLWDRMETNLRLLVGNDSLLKNIVDATARNLSADDRSLGDAMDIATKTLSDIINQSRTDLLAFAEQISLLETGLQRHVNSTITAIQAINQTVRENSQVIQNLAQKQLADLNKLADNLTKALNSLNDRIGDTARTILDRLEQELLAVAGDTASLQSRINALTTDTQTLRDNITALDNWAKTQADQLETLMAGLAQCDELLAKRIEELRNVTGMTDWQVEQIKAELTDQDTAINQMRQNLAAIWAELSKDALPVEFYSCSGWHWGIDRRIVGATLFNTQTTIFSNQLIFSVQNLTHSILYKYSPAAGSLAICQTVPLPGLFASKTIDDRLYVIKLFASFPIYNGTIYSTTDLETWTVEAYTDQCCLQSIGKYAPTGEIYAGGVYSRGDGTYTRIMKLSDGSLNVVWDGTICGSDDGLQMEMFNSTLMVCIDAYKANAIYSTDPDNWWIDPWQATLYDWVRSVEIREDGNMWMAGYDDASTGQSGLANWDGKGYTNYVLDKTCWLVCNGSVGVSEGRENPPIGTDPEYPCSIYTYTTEGTLGRPTLRCSCRSVVGGMAYDSSRNRLFALFWVPPYGVFVLEGYPSTFP